LITACIAELKKAGYGQTAEILAIARLDLLACRHGVSEEEMDFLISAPPAKSPKEESAAIRSKPTHRKTTHKAPAQNKSG